MQPRLNVEINNLFIRTADNFVPAGAQMPNDYMDASSDDAPEFKAIQEQQRMDQAAQYDRDNASGQAHGQSPSNPAQQTAPYGQPVPDAGSMDLTIAAKQANGFQTKQARVNVTMGVIADISNNTLVGSRAVFKTARKTVEGTVIAVGDNEFAVIWDDKTASVERKNDYELVIKA